MVKIHIYSESRLEKWDGAVVELSRVPCVGEWVRPTGHPAKEVTRVIHGAFDDDDTVAGITLKG